MTEVVGSFDRTYTQPMLRPRNKNLNLIVAPSRVMNHYYQQDKSDGRREENKNLDKAIGYKYTEYQRLPNDQVVKMENEIETGQPFRGISGGSILSGATMGMSGLGDNITGGSFLTKNHPRLARDPNWYPGRGQDRAIKTLKKVGTVAASVLPELLI